MSTSIHEARPKRFTLEEYAQLTKIGFFKEDDRIELIRGELIEMAAKGTKHTVCCQRLLKVLLPLLSDMTLRCQDPVQLLSGSEPEPDFVVVRDRAESNRSRRQQANLRIVPSRSIPRTRS